MPYLGVASIVAAACTDFVTKSRTNSPRSATNFHNLQQSDLLQDDSLGRGGGGGG